VRQALHHLRTARGDLPPGGQERRPPHRLRRPKLRASFALALRKRPVSTEQVDSAIEHIEEKLLNLPEREVPSHRLGEMVMRELKKLDKVAYIRFASVYRSFEDIDEFKTLVDEVQMILEKRAGAVGCR
jgi:transcriptional regulator NrdR